MSFVSKIRYIHKEKHLLFLEGALQSEKLKNKIRVVDLLPKSDLRIMVYQDKGLGANNRSLRTVDHSPDVLCLWNQR